MKLTTRKFEAKIKTLSNNHKLLFYTGLIIVTLFTIYQFGIAFGKFYYYTSH
jgi:hypothetical protein